MAVAAAAAADAADDPKREPEYFKCILNDLVENARAHTHTIARVRRKNAFLIYAVRTTIRVCV